MISKLIILDCAVSDEVRYLLNIIKSDDTMVSYYDYSKGFIVNGKNDFIDYLFEIIRNYMEVETVNLEHICLMNLEQMKNSKYSSNYNNELHLVKNIENNTKSLESWNFMMKLISDISKTTEIRNIDFFDVNHICFPKEYKVIFDNILEIAKSVENFGINYLKIPEDAKEELYASNNWIHTIFTSFYQDSNKALLDKYFKANNSTIGYMNTQTMKLRDLRVYDNHNLSVNIESELLNIIVIPLFIYSSAEDYELFDLLMANVNNNTLVVCVYENDTEDTLMNRLTEKLDGICNDKKDKIYEVNLSLWFNPKVENDALMLSKNISVNVDDNDINVINHRMVNNNENIDILKNHFVVSLNESIIDYFSMNVFEEQKIKKINFDILNVSEKYNKNYNILCQFLHNDYFVSTLVNYNLTFLSSADTNENLFELQERIEEFDEFGVIIDVSHNIFKETQLILDISNNEAYQGDLFIYTTSHSNKNIQYNNDIILSTYLSSDGPEIDKFMKPNVITNVILYDRELFEHLSDVRSCLLPNTLLLTFDKQNTYQDIKDGLLRINELNGVQISNVALFQDNDSRSKTYNFVGEETSTIKYPMMDDPSLNTWSKFQDFVLFLDTEMNVKYLDLMMCKIYSNPNWKYVIDTISSNLSSLVIRSSENNTGHTMFEGDWILESPVVDVNMINVYFKESIKELDIQLGTNVNIGDYTKIGWMKTSHRWIDNNAWSAGGPMFSVRCHTRQASDYSFTSQTPSESAYTINFDNNIDVLISPVGWSNSYNYSDTITQSNFNQKTHSQSPGNLYLAFDDESSVDENTWFIPVTAIWNGMNHSSKNFTAFSHTNYWDLTDTAGYESLFGTLTTTHQTGITYNSTAYFYVGPYTAYSGIPNPVPIPTPSEGMVFPKLTDSDSNEISGNLYVSGGKTYISYEITSTSTINFSHDLNNVDIFIVAGGGGGSGGRAGSGGGAGGVVVGTGISSITSGEHTIAVGEGGAGGTSASSWAAESGGNSVAFGYIAMGGGRGSIAGNGMDGRSIWNIDNNINEDSNGGSGGANETAVGKSTGYHNDTGTFEFTGGSANYNNDSSTYSNVMIYGYNGGGHGGDYKGTSPGGGGAGGVGGNGNIPGGSNYHSGAGGVGMTNNFLNGLDNYYAGGGGGGNLHAGYNEGESGNGGGGAGGNVPSSGLYANPGLSGTPNTGGGGGGASVGNGGSNANGGSGGSGIVILRFVLAENENLPAVSSATDDFTTKFFNYNSGEALVATEDESGNKATTTFTESTTAYLNYDISGAEIKEYVAPQGSILSQPQSTDISFSSQIVSLDAGVYNIVVDKPAVSEPISTDDLQMEYIANTNTSTTTTWTSTYTADGTSHDMNIPSWPLTTTNDEYYYTIDNKNSAYPYYPTASKNYHYNDLDDYTTTGQKGLTYEAWIYVDSWPADGTEPGTSSADPKRGAWGWLMGLHTGNAMYLILNQEDIGGIGMHPPANRSTHGTTYELNNGTSLTNPGYITENTQQLLHIVGYMYPTSTTDVERGVYINGTHYPQFSLLQSNSAIPGMFNNQTYNFTINNLQNDWFGACKATRLYSFRVWHRQLTETEINSIYSMGPYGSILSQPTSDISTNITVDLSTNTITSNVDFEIKYTPIDLSLSELTKDTTINPVRSQTIPFVKSGGVQEERSVTLHGDATYNRFANEYYFPGDLSGYASIEGQLFGEHAMSMSFMYKSGGEQPVLETINNDGEIKHFSTNGTLTLTKDVTVDILIVGGGGAGGNALGGGGGAGGVVYTVNQTMTAGTYNIFVGAGGQGQDYSAGSVESNNGEDSYISDSNGSIITMDMGGVTQELKGHGGGGGGSRRELGSVYSTSYNGIGNNGGSSGGVGAPSYYNTFDSGGNLILSNLPNATPTQLDTFYDVSTQTYIKGGSDGSTYASKGTGSLVRWTSGGGGGGMGPANDDSGHDGDDGIYVDICGGITVAAGGGGAQYSHHLSVHYASDVNYGKGGSGIGGDGVVYDANNGQNVYWGVDVGSQFYERGIPTSGLDGTGSGGGGWSDRQKYNGNYYPAGSGGSGIIIIKIHSAPPPVRNIIAYIGHPYPSPLNQNAHDTNDFAIYSSPNDQASIFYKEDETSIKEVPSATFDNSSNYTHIAITMNEDLTLNETNGFKMYVNGVLEKSGNLSANNGALISGVSQPLQLLGKGPLSGSSESSAFKGYLKNVRFYDSVLSQSEVTTIYTNMITNEYTDNKNFVSQVVPNLVISSSDISSGDHTELTSISMEITATPDSSLNITSSDIDVVNGTISIFTNNTTNTWSFDFTPASSNVESTLSISESSLFDNIINNMTDKPSWFTTNNNHASNMFKFMKTDVEMDLMPPLQDQTIAMITSTGSHIEIPVTLNGTVTYDASKNEYDISENGYLSIDEDVIRDGDLTISLMYAMRSGNQYGNDQLVNFSDSNSLNTSSDSTDIHIFRDGTTPGAWFYYGSPDDNGMAISEAGLEVGLPLVNTETTVTTQSITSITANNTVVDIPDATSLDSIDISEGYVQGAYQSPAAFTGVYKVPDTYQWIIYYTDNNHKMILVEAVDVGGNIGIKTLGQGYASASTYSEVNLTVYNNRTNVTTQQYGLQNVVVNITNTETNTTPKYTHMAITIKEGQVKQFYINGEVVDYVNKYRSNALPVSRAIVGGKRQHQLFGYGYAANRGFSGLMKNIRIYNKALTSYEMRHLYAINSNFNDNDFANTTLIPVPRPTLTFSAPLPESKILDGNGAEMTFNSFVKNGKEYKAYSFTNTGTTSITIDRDATDVEILIVGGGGGGGFWAGGGGGAGGVVYAVNQTLTAGTYNIEVGAGGVGWRQGGGVVPTNIGGDGIYHSQSGLDSSIKQSGTPISLVNNTINAIGYGGGGGGNIINHDSGSQAAGVSGGSGGGSSGPWNNSSNNTIYTGGTATQGNTLYDISAQSYVAGGNNGNTLIGDALQTTNYKPIMGMGGGGASAIIYNDDDTDTGWSHVNGKNGIEIDIGGSTLTVAAGGGGSQMGYHPSWHGPGSGSTGMYNTNLNRGLGGSNGVGGDGMLWRTGWVQAISGKDYPAHYKRLASDGADNTGSGGGGSQPGESGSAEAYYTSGSGGSGIVIIQFPKAEVASGSSLDQSTLDLKLTVSDDGLDGNISSSDIITSNGTITAFSQSSPTTWDLTYTSDYNKQSNVSSIFIEQDTIYNRDVSDLFAPEATFSSAPTTTTVLAGGGGLNGTGGTQGTAGGSNRHRSDGIYDFRTMWNGTLNDSNDTWGSYASNGNNVSSYYLYFTFPGETVINKYFLWKRVSGTGTDQSWSEHAPGTWELRGTNNISGYNDTDSSTYDVLDSRTVSKSVWDTVTLQANTNHTSSVNNLTNCLGFSFSNIQSYKTYVISVSSNVGGVGDTMHSIGEMALAADRTESGITPPSWWTREHNKASNKFEWTALNSGASDTSTTPTRPSITFSSLDLNHGESQNLGTVSMTIYVSSNNLNVVQADLSFSNGVVSNFTKVSNNYYTFDFKSESVSQASTIQVLQDTVSNTETVTDFNEASNVFEWTWSFTVTPPEITITSSDVTHGGNFGVQEVNMLLEFSGEVLHGNSIESTFSQFDVSAVNGYVFDISVISQTQIAFKLGSSSITESTSVFIPQNIVSRTFNNIYKVNTNNTSNVFTWSYDSADLTISSLVVNNANGNTINAGDNINSNELWLQFTFSESIYNFDKSYFNVTNCKITNISTDTTFTTFTIKTETYFPTSPIIELQSNKLITTGRGLQKYITGSSNLSFNWNYDDTRPNISMTSSQVSGLTNNVSFVDLSFVSTMNTSDFTESSIVVTGDASLSGFTTISATEYSIRVTPNSTSNINITVPVNSYTEQYGNSNENEVSFDWNYDNVPPTVEIFSPDISNGASSSDLYIDIYFTMSKPVDDFVLNDDANVVNGVLGSMTKTNTFVNHTATFNVTVATKTASHQYQPGNGSSGSGYYLNGVESPLIDFIVGQTYTFDQSDSTNSTHPLKFYTTAEKDVLYTSGVVYTDSQGTSGATTTIVIDETTPSPLYYQCGLHGFMGFKGETSKKESYTAKLYPTQNDTVSVYIFANSITDSAGNENVSDSNEFDWIFDSNDLLTTLSSGDVTNNGTFTNDSITISLTTTEAIVLFEDADISYQNGTISNVDSSAKTFTITSNAQGVPTTAFIIGGAVKTSLGEENIESNIFSWTYNPPIPKLVITSSQINEGVYTNNSSIDFTLTFDQANVVFDQNSLSVYNGTISSFSGSGTMYQVTIDTSVTSDDLIRLTLPQGNAHVDHNGVHENDISYNFEWNYDSVVPAITIGSSIINDDGVTNLTSLSLSVTSSEEIEGLKLSDFVVSNAVISNLSDTSGSSFIMTIQPLDDTTDCSINIFLKDDSVTDRAGNINSQSNTFAFSYEFFSRKQESSAIEQIFENDVDIPADEKLSSSEIDLVISAAFTIPDTTSPFAAATSDDSETGESNDDNNDTTTTKNPTFIDPPKITFPPAIKIKNRKVFTKLIDQIFATASESVKTLKIDKSSVVVAAAAEVQIADVEEIVMVKSNQTEPIDMSTLVEDPTKPSATYIPLANVGDFAIVAIDGVEYTTVVDGEGVFILSSNNGGTIDNPDSGDGKWYSNDIYEATNINKIIFGSQIISTSAVTPDPPTLTITSGQVSNGGTTDISYIDLSFVFSTTVEISLNDIEAFNANTSIISRSIESIDSSNSYISVTVAPVDASINNTLGVFVDISAFYDTNNTFNDVQYVYSWSYSLDGGGSGGVGISGSYIPCFLEGTKILTTKGYKNVERLDPKKDKLLDKDNKPLQFLDLQTYSQENNGKQYPYKIPSGSELSADYKCICDLYLTYNHCVYLPHLDKFAPVASMKHLKEDKTLTQKKFTYYHVFTENYFNDTLMANGIPCESHSKYTFEKLRTIDPSDKLLRKVIKKADMMPNCMRNRLTTKEMKQIIKKFKSKQNKNNLNVRK